MPLHATLGEEFHACKLAFLDRGGNLSTQLHMQEISRLLEGSAHLWLGFRLAA